ncbi:MAG: Ig-like domain repeat protein [Methanobacteriaceae archaeon]|nr:Ig-like domain repeat protein [Methanobacteriaceae archaeon]
MILGVKSNLKSNNIYFFTLILFLAIIMSISTVSAASGDVIYVNGTSGDDNNNGSDWAHAKKTILNATGSVNENGTINMVGGVYNGTSNAKITINKNMNIFGEVGSNYFTIINGSATDWVLKINSGVKVNLTNLYFFQANSIEGSAINNTGDLKIENCTFGSNYASDRGGAILNMGNLSITETVFQENTANQNGGSIYNKANMTIYNCTFTGNDVWSSGGAIYMDSSSKNSIYKTTFYGCSANDGGALYTSSNSNQISHCTFLYNYAINGGAIYTPTGTSVVMSRFNNNNAEGNGNAIYSGSWLYCGLNWWGSNNPNFDTLVYCNNAYVSSPWIYAVLNVNNNSIVSGDVAKISLDFNYFFNGTDLSYTTPQTDSIFNDLSVTFNLIGNGTLSPLISTIKDGIAITNFTGTYPDISTITTQFDGQTFDIPINVSKSNCSIILQPASGKYRDVTAFIAFLNHQLGQFSNATVKFYLNDILIGNSTTISEGVAVLPYYINLNSSITPYTIKAVFEGDDFYNNAENVNEFYINPANVNLIVNPVNTTYNGPVNLTANLVDELGNPIARQVVNFYINGQLIGNATTSYEGIANIPYLANLSPGASPYAIMAVYAGNQNYVSRNSTSTLNVKKTNTHLSISNLIANKGAVVKLTTTLKDIYNRLIPNQSVNFKVNGIIIGKAVTNSQGQANLYYKVNLNGGNYNVIAEFGGNDNYNGNNSIGTLKVPQAYLIQKTISIPKLKMNKKFNLYYKITNNGPDVAENTIITIKLPKYYKLSRISGKSWTYNKKTKTLTWKFTKLSKGTFIIKISGQIVKKGTYTFKPSIKSSTYNIQRITALKIKIKK